MRAVKFDLNIFKALLRQLKLNAKYSMLQYREDWEKPEIKTPNQVIVKTRLGGICASDLHQINIETSYYGSLLLKAENPSMIGHEIVGEVAEVGASVKNWKLGDRVVYNPVHHCAEFGFDPCPSCKAGKIQMCYTMVGVGDGSEKEALYGGRDHFGGLGAGGYAEYFPAFEKQLYQVPPELPDELAVLAEPFTVAIHAVFQNPPKNTDTVVVVGAGIIGLMVVAAIRAYGSTARILCLARYPFQAEAAKQLGADEIISERDSTKIYDKITELTGGSLFKPTLGKRVLYGENGPDIFYDTIVSESSMDDALRLVKTTGKIVAIGLGYVKPKHIDWSLQIYKEIVVAGSFTNGDELIDGTRKNCFEIALAYMNTHQEMFHHLVTHRFSIDHYKEALQVARSKGPNKAIKVVFEYK